MTGEGQWCTGRLWLEGFEPTAKAFIEAIPRERRDRFDRVVFVGPDTIEEMGHYVPDVHRERGIVYLVATRDGRYAFAPVTRPYVEHVVAGGAGAVLSALEAHLFPDEPD